MSDARATIEFAIIDGLAESAHITGASPEHAQIQAKDIVDSLFSPALVWAVSEYLKEKAAEQGR